MRRFITVCICLLLVPALSLSAAATEAAPYPTAGDLAAHWTETDTIPDYITGIWSTDGSLDNITFGLVPGDDGIEGMKQIIALIEDDSTALFTTQFYSRNKLWAMMEDINTYFEKGLGFTCAGVNEHDNRIDIELHLDYAQNPDTQAAVAELEEKYGDAVSISFTDTVIEAVAGQNPAPPMMHRPTLDPTNPASPLPLLLGVCCVMLCGLVFVNLRRRALVTAGAGAEIPESQLSVRETELAVKKYEPAVPRSLDDRIERSLNRTFGNE